MNIVGSMHQRLVIGRRVRILSKWFAELIPRNATVLDVGCGSGLVAGCLLALRPDLVLEGVDVLVRQQTCIPVRSFDGYTLPYPDGAFETVLFADVLHHTEDPMVLLREARRVSRKVIVIKDHEREGIFSGARLRLMDWVGNARFGVSLPYNYWNRSRWAQAWKELELFPERMERNLNLYPPPFDFVFGASLHFIARLHASNIS
ncbi:MAG TPA: class I SAM-dependent methyltransferase [Terriglobales bacterium]|nr:class I SAM-dependent methyltransferase [Terriglobales bacterium]